MTPQRYYSFNTYLRQEFGERIHRISVNGGFKCPNLDGTKSSQGCIFCNNKAFSRHVDSDQISLEEQISKGLEYTRKRFGAKKFIVYFQSFSSTYGDVKFLEQQYLCIQKFDDIVGLSISTRPDCIDEKKLDMIANFTKNYKVYIEYGLQTIHDKTLKFINRNHTFNDFEKTVERTAARGIAIGVHIILGLPGEDKNDMLKTAKTIADMPLWGIKFHCFHVVKNTLLEDMYKNGGIQILTEDEYIDILIRFLEITPKNRVILRLVSDADKDLLIVPAWVNDKQRMIKKIQNELKKQDVFQGDLYASRTL